MPRLCQIFLAVCGVAAPFGASAQIATPTDHPGFALAEAIASRGCVLHQDDVNELLAGVGLTNEDFPQMAVPLMQTGHLRSVGEGRLRLVNWGLCQELAPGVEDVPFTHPRPELQPLPRP